MNVIGGNRRAALASARGTGRAAYTKAVWRARQELPIRSSGTVPSSRINDDNGKWVSHPQAFVGKSGQPPPLNSWLALECLITASGSRSNVPDARTEE